MTAELETRNAAPRLDNRHPDLFGQTPSQTVGPYFHYGLPWKGGADLVGQSDMGARADLFPEAHYVLNLSSPRGVPRGEVVELSGLVLDARDRAEGDEARVREAAEELERRERHLRSILDTVPDAMVELWQANADGRYRSHDDARDEVPLDPAFVGFGRASTSAEGEWRFRTVRPGRVPGALTRAAAA